MLAALAAEPARSPQSAEFLAATGYANQSGVKRALTSLSDAGIVTLREGAWTVVNPFVRRWLLAG